MVAIDTILCDVVVQNKKQLFETISKELSEVTNINHYSIGERLFERDRLLLSAIGNGVAVPQAEIAGLDKSYVLVAKLKNPIPFCENKTTLVDVVCSFISPAGAGAVSLTELARVMRMMRDDETVNLIRGANSKDAIEAILVGHQEEKRQAA